MGWKPEGDSGSGREQSSFAESIARDQVQGGMSNIAPMGTTSFVYQNNNNYVDANMFLNEHDSNLLTESSNKQQQYYRENAASMDTYINLYQGVNPTCNIATNQHLSYEHNTATAITTTTMHSVNQHSIDNTALVYPPHPPISWVAQPVSMAMPPQSMAQAVSVAAPPQNMAQAMSQPVSMATLPQNIEEEMAVNLPKSNSFD